MMKYLAWALLPALVLTGPLAAEPPAAADTSAAAAAEPVVADADVAPPKACKKKQKKGLSGMLRAARSSGLVSVVAGKAGTGGALVNSVANTAIDVAAAADHMAPPPPVEAAKC